MSVTFRTVQDTRYSTGENTSFTSYLYDSIGENTSFTGYLYDFTGENTSFTSYLYDSTGENTSFTGYLYGSIGENTSFTGDSRNSTSINTKLHCYYAETHNFATKFSFFPLKNWQYKWVSNIILNLEKLARFLLRKIVKERRTIVCS
ncbi:hypothetical protein [Lysinibacillus sp. FSL W8-0992]|uniref:hypothetical protein n=1 Tax=Lysinibacillus sp. FSL W8-0992 TaxID=2954643 RepID=UPI0030F4EEC9